MLSLGRRKDEDIIRVESVEIVTLGCMQKFDQCVHGKYQVVASHYRRDEESTETVGVLFLIAEGSIVGFLPQHGGPARDQNPVF